MSLAIPRREDSGSLLEEGYFRSLDLLRRNAIPEGILACTPGERASGRHYESIFGRDASICALGMFVSQEPDLIAVARDSLRTLARHQAANGQIAKYVKPQCGEVDFWYTGCIDATVWWLIAVRLHDRFLRDLSLEEELRSQVERAWQWLLCQEHPSWHLLQQNEASDWADIMPRSGFVLYTNTLWYWVKRLYDHPSAQATRDYANVLFSPFGPDVAEQRRVRLMVDYMRNGAKPNDFYLSFVNFSFGGEEIDTFGNVLAALTGIADSSRGSRIASALTGMGVHRPWPLRVVGEPLEKSHPLWRPYMERHQQNFPFQYHNGGSWPFVGGFWVLMLKQLGMEEEAWQELENLALANQCQNWQFNEWFHGQSGAPMGMAGQSWNAALYILAWQALNGRLQLFD
jgi:glycogen debranching enzyme